MGSYLPTDLADSKIVGFGSRIGAGKTGQSSDQANYQGIRGFLPNARVRADSGIYRSQEGGASWTFSGGITQLLQWKVYYTTKTGFI